MNELTVMDIFCGGGGFSEGFRQQGFEIVYGIDSWKPAVDTFNHNFGMKCVARDVLDFEACVDKIEALPDTDVIIGSPPCVSFSSSNKSGKADKSMGLRLTKTFLKIIVVKKHKRNSRLKAWVMENVRNSATHLEGFYTFEQLGLAVWAEREGLKAGSVAIRLDKNRSVVNSADFGVPQSRERVFTGEIIVKNKALVPQKTHEENSGGSNLPGYLTLGSVREHLPKPNSDLSEAPIVDPLYPNLMIRKCDLSDQFYDTGLYASEWELSRFLKTNHPYMGPMSFPERVDRPSRTVTATRIGASREAIIFQSEKDRKGDGQFRTLTVREAATLMGFPIIFQFLGSEGNKWKLVGNAVCPPVSRAFAKIIRNECGLESLFAPSVISPQGSQSVSNLNTYVSKRFDDPPKKKKGARFRRHPFKHGNMTVTLSNYDIKKNKKHGRKWRSSIQYGTGEGFPVQSFRDGYFNQLEPIILSFEGGPDFIETINNGFSEKIPASKLMQHMYETHRSEGEHVDPVKLVKCLADIIESIEIAEPNFDQGDRRLFMKQSVPKKQVMALYAINKICSLANGGKNR